LNYNVSEALGFLALLIKNSIIEGFKLPSTILEDEVNTNENENAFNNTILGEILINNINGILKHFVIENDTEEIKKIEGTYGEMYVPLGNKRYIFFIIFYKLL